MTAPTKPPEAVKVTQGDREAAAGFVRQAWHLFWPNDHERAMQDAADMVAGRCDNWLLAESFVRHREDERKRIVDWLRERASEFEDKAKRASTARASDFYRGKEYGFLHAAQRIERGDHHSGEQ